MTAAKSQDDREPEFSLVGYSAPRQAPPTNSAKGGLQSAARRAKRKPRRGKVNAVTGQVELPRPDNLGRLRPRRIGQRGGLSHRERWAAEDADVVHAEYKRPQSIGECPKAEGIPCPWVACRYHTTAEVLPDGSLSVRRAGPWPDADLADSVAEELARGDYETCSLRLAEQGPRSIAEVARLTGLSSRMVRGTLREARRKLKAALVREGLDEAFQDDREGDWTYPADPFGDV